MIPALLMLLSLAIPGAVVLRRAAPDLLESGAPGVFAASTTAGLALLAPFVLLGYAVNLPALALGALWGVAVLAGAAALTRGRVWGPALRACRSASAVGAALLLLVVVLTLAHGSWVNGDGMVHLARIRTILDHGLTNIDPFVKTPDSRFAIYPFNLVHALGAAVAAALAADHVDVWWALAAWGKLLFAGASGLLAWSIFASRPAAWGAAVITLLTTLPMEFANYPNKLAPLALLPVGLALAVRAGAEAPTRARAGQIALVSLLLGMTHGLYAVFFAVAVGPTLIAAGIIRARRRRRSALPAALCVAALAVGLPFALATPLWTIFNDAPAAAATADPAPAPASTTLNENPDDFITVAGMRTRNPANAFGGPLFHKYALLAGALLLAWRLGRRPHAAASAALFLTAAAALFLPPLSEALIRVLGREWLLGRMEIILPVLYRALLGGALMTLAARWWTAPAKREASVAALAVLTLLLTLPAGPRRALDYLRGAVGGTFHHEQAEQLRAIRDTFREALPPGSTVLTDASTGMWLCAAYDLRIVAPQQASLGVPDMNERRADLRRLLPPDTPWPERRALLQKHDIRYVWLTQGMDPTWVQQRAEDVWQDQDRGVLLIRVRP